MERRINLIVILFEALLLISSAIAKDDIENDISLESFGSTTASSIDSINLRKALLRALTELENEEIQKDDLASKTLFFSTTANTPEPVIEKASASAITILAKDNNGNTKLAEKQIDAEKELEEEPETEKPIVIIQKSDGIQHRPIISVLNEDTNEALSLSASSSFTDDESSSNNFIRSSPKPLAKSLNPNAVTVNDKSFTPGVKSISITPKYESTTVTTLKPTTTTEESQAKVEDVQFFSAPLVAAFTVHQDERGLPNKVEPIYKQAGQSSVSASEVADKERQEIIQQEEAKLDEYRRKLETEAKQKALEFQLKTLQEQQKQQQEYLLRQQRIIQDQQIQHQRLLQQQTKLRQNDQPFIPIINQNQQSLPLGPSTTEKPIFFTTPNNINSFGSTFQKSQEINPTISHFNGIGSTAVPIPPKFFQELPLTTPSPLFNPNNNQLSGHRFNNFNNVNHISNQNSFSSNGNSFTKLNNFNNLNSNGVHKFQNTLISIQPALSLSPNDLQAGKLPLNAQILPVRNAIDFHQSPNPNTHFNFRQPTLLNQQQQFFPNSFQTFPSSNNFNHNLPNVRQGNRIFRQELNTGNFGFNQVQNNHQPSFSIQQSLEQPTRFFRSNANVYQPQNANQQLNTLLYHSGITRNVRQNDDLHIVSKILSFNLGRENLYASSRVHEQRVKQ